MEITCGVSPDGQNIEVSVADTGIGIKEADMAYIFNEFRQVEGTVIKERGGTGKEKTMRGEKKELEVFGATIQCFAGACKDLKIVAGSRAVELIIDVEVNKWYPFKRLRDIEATVIETYQNAGPILERAGIEMMRIWYNLGPGKEIINTGVDFLRFQSGSQGYASVVRGSKDLVGSFELVEINENEGKALIHSTTPFNKDLERGIIIGGMSAPGDLNYIKVNNDEDEHYFKIEFS